MNRIAWARRFVRAHPYVSALAPTIGVLLLFWLVGTTLSRDIASTRASGPTLLVLSTIGALPLLMRRWVWPAMAFTVFLTLAVPVWFATTGSESFTALVLVFSVAARGSRPQTAVAAGLLLVAFTVALFIVPTSAPLGTLLGYCLMFFAALALGLVASSRRSFFVALEERARFAEESRELAAKEAVLAERHRIAHELHDLVAHHVSAMNVLAAGARRTLRAEPEVAERALVTIEETGRTTLRQMRRLLEVLRSDDADETPPHTPQPGVPGIQALVSQIHAAGLPVSLQVEGTPPELDAGIDLTVFRIVQEALTNTLKHAGPTEARVTLRYEADALAVAVVDSGRGASGTGITADRGHGLVGIKERVGLYGGDLYTGAAAGGGFAVRARIPYDRPATTGGRWQPCLTSSDQSARSAPTDAPAALKERPT